MSCSPVEESSFQQAASGPQSLPPLPKRQLDTQESGRPAKKQKMNVDVYKYLSRAEEIIDSHAIGTKTSLGRTWSALSIQLGLLQADAGLRREAQQRFRNIGNALFTTHDPSTMLNDAIESARTGDSTNYEHLPNNMQILASAQAQAGFLQDAKITFEHARGDIYNLSGRANQLSSCNIATLSANLLFLASAQKEAGLVDGARKVFDEVKINLNNEQFPHYLKFVAETQNNLGLRQDAKITLEEYHAEINKVQAVCRMEVEETNQTFNPASQDSPEELKILSYLKKAMQESYQRAAREIALKAEEIAKSTQNSDMLALVADTQISLGFYEDVMRHSSHQVEDVIEAQIDAGLFKAAMHNAYMYEHPEGWSYNSYMKFRILLAQVEENGKINLVEAIEALSEAREYAASIQIENFYSELEINPLLELVDIQAKLGLASEVDITIAQIGFIQGEPIAEKKADFLMDKADALKIAAYHFSKNYSNSRIV